MGDEGWNCAATFGSGEGRVNNGALSCQQRNQVPGAQFSVKITVQESKSAQESGVDYENYFQLSTSSTVAKPSPAL
jgi:hypothetical protein